MEVVSGVASAFAIAEYSLKIITFVSSLCSKLHEAPENLRMLEARLKDLNSIMKVIEKNASLNTQEMNSMLERCYRDAEKLDNLLASITTTPDDGKIQRYWKPLGSVIKENEVIDLCAKLYNHIILFSAYITSVDSALLQSMSIDLEGVHRSLNFLIDMLRSTTLGISVMQDDVAFIRESLTQAQIQEPISYPVLKGNERKSAFEITVNDLLSNDKVAACISSLASASQEMYLRELRLPSEGSCQWFLDSERFRLWLRRSDDNLLYVTARAGCGKSTIVANLIRYLEETFANPTCQNQGQIVQESCGHILLYFCFRKGIMDTINLALRSLVNQMIKRAPYLYRHILAQYNILMAKGTFSWPVETLYLTLDEMLKEAQKNHSVYIVLDAIDESSGPIDRFLLFIQGLNLETVRDSDQMYSGKTKVLMTGRQEEATSNKWLMSHRMRISPEDTSKDMATLIAVSVEHLANLRNLPHILKEQIQEFLEKNAQGMFLWVELVVKELESRHLKLTNATIVQKLSTVPVGLSDIYEGILERLLLSPRRDDIWRVFRWLIYGNRALVIADLEAAFLIEQDGEDCLNSVDITDIKNLCNGLIRESENQELEFIHQTVREFLLEYLRTAGAAELGGFRMDENNSNEHLATVCVDRLRQSKLEELLEICKLYCSPSAYIEKVDNWLSRLPFLAYAAEFWISHLQALTNPGPTLVSSIAQLLESQARRDALIRLTYFFNHSGSPFAPHGASQLHLAGYYKLHWLIDTFIQRGLDPNIKGVAQDTPLIWTSEMGCVACVKRLLIAGAIPNMAEFDGWSPLHWAATNGHIDVCKLLLKYGADIDTCDGRKLTVTDWALRRNHLDIVDLLKEWKDKTFWEKATSKRLRSLTNNIADLLRKSKDKIFWERATSTRLHSLINKKSREASQITYGMSCYDLKEEAHDSNGNMDRGLNSHQPSQLYCAARQETLLYFPRQGKQELSE